RTRPPPNRSDKVVFANHAVTVLDEIQQQVEHLRLKRDELRAPPKLPAIRIEYLVFKAKLHVRPRGRFSRYAKVYRKDNSSRYRRLLCSCRKRPRLRTTPTRAAGSSEAQDKASHRLNVQRKGASDRPRPLWVKSKHSRRKKSCPLYPRKQTCAVQLGMSALGQKRTFGLLIRFTWSFWRQGHSERPAQ